MSTIQKGAITAGKGALQPDSSYRRNGDGAEESLVYLGLYDDQKAWCADNAPPAGASYQIEGRPGGVGRLTITRGTGRYGSSGQQQEGDALFARSFADYYVFARPIISYQNFGASGASSREALIAWQNEPDSGLRASLSYMGQGNDGADFWGIVALSGFARTVAIWLSAGRATVDVWLPVVERVTRLESATQPPAENLGQIMVPAAGVAPPLPEPAADYQWRKVADRSDPADAADPENRLWIRREKWMAELKPELLFPGTAPATP